MDTKAVSWQRSILAISDDSQLVQTLYQASQGDDFSISLRQVMNPMDALRDLGEDIDLILLDSNVRNSAAELAFLESLQTHGSWRHLPVLVLIDCELPCDLAAAYRDKATSVTTRPYSLPDWISYWQTIRQAHTLIR